MEEEKNPSAVIATQINTSVIHQFPSAVIATQIEIDPSSRHPIPLLTLVLYVYNLGIKQLHKFQYYPKFMEVLYDDLMIIKSLVNTLGL